MVVPDIGGHYRQPSIMYLISGFKLLIFILKSVTYIASSQLSVRPSIVREAELAYTRGYFDMQYSLR